MEVVSFFRVLLRPDATFIHQAIKRPEFVFPRGTAWLHFESQFPAKEVFENSVLDPAVGLAGDLGAQAFAAADWQNWISTTKISLYEIGTRIGLPDLEGTPLTSGLASVYDNISSSVQILKHYDDPSELIPELLKNAGLQVVQQLAGSTNMIAQTVAQVIAAAVWAVDVVAAHKEDLLGKNIALPPLQSEDPATDSWQVNRVFEVFRTKGVGGVVYPDGGTAPASNADYTSLFLPAYRYNRKWALQHREQGVAAQQGKPTKARGPGGEETTYNFDPGDGSSFGFMPGTTTTLRVLQASYRLYHTTRGTPVNRYTVRCNGVDKGCGKSVKAFNGSKDCRQCVDPESVWPVQGVGWAYGGAPLNATTPGENAGAFYPSTNKLLLNLLEQIARPGPLLYTVHVDEMVDRWKKSFEKFWEFADAEWRRHRGVAWRGLISRLATTMTALEVDGDAQPGGRDPRMPLSRIANPREGSFDVPFEHSIFAAVIEPFCQDLLELQYAYLRTVNVAYIPPGAGALSFPSGKLRRTKLADRFVQARVALLNSNARVLVDLRQVSDPEYRAELEAAGVKPSPVNPKLFGSPGMGDGAPLQAPSITKRTPRLPKPPKIVYAPPLGSAGLLQGPLLARPARGSQTTPKSSGAAGLGVAAITLAATGAAAYALSRKKPDRDR